MSNEEFLIETNLGVSSDQTHIKAVNGQVIKANIDRLIQLIQQFGQDSTGNLELDEVTVSIKITEDGNIVLLSNGGQSSNLGTMTLRFKRPISGLASIETSSNSSLPVEAKLVSAIGIDYTKLQMLLVNQQWQPANQETWDVMCQALLKNKGSYLSPDDIKRIPCQDLEIIDRLWQKYSQGKFGFSVQKSIYDQFFNSK